MNQDGILVVHKPAGPSSFDIVRLVRKVSRIKKVGHTGTLDPFASGVLVLLLGNATKLSSVLVNADKTYRGTVLLGKATDTLDRTGNITGEFPVPSLSFEEVENCLKGFQGIWHQTPPMFSAKKVQGVRLYHLARNGQTLEREKVPVYLHSLKLERWESPEAEIEVHCSKGTYIRSLAEEFGRRLGTLGHLSKLERLACGSFSLSESVTVEECENDWASCSKKAQDNIAKFRALRVSQWKLPPTRLPSLA